jgi:hypothetical protein
MSAASASVLSNESELAETTRQVGQGQYALRVRLHLGGTGTWRLQPATINETFNGDVEILVPMHHTGID